MGLREADTAVFVAIGHKVAIVAVFAIDECSVIEMDGLELRSFAAAAVPIEADAVVALVATFDAF